MPAVELLAAILWVTTEKNGPRLSALALSSSMIPSCQPLGLFRGPAISVGVSTGNVANSSRSIWLKTKLNGTIQNESQAITWMSWMHLLGTVNVCPKSGTRASAWERERPSWNSAGQANHVTTPSCDAHWHKKTPISLHCERKSCAMAETFVEHQPRAGLNHKLADSDTLLGNISIWIKMYLIYIALYNNPPKWPTNSYCHCNRVAWLK